ncbi:MULTISPECIES: thioesterase II family protein [unclassified Pseudoalteromonas]|uniref:thioesterase II family protein n=1 Tax=unclassified Pseudoalteromonas TaxID=194690 RepID=UPI000428C696|nr:MULTISPECIES: thioesterase domain-containing protein [unclassified Pseudoalteromonas]PCC14213.1 thioesterase [Pseudoalteromonas sp. JB197]SJN16404.1 Thioesterase [Pseudoalteromonas sp. JB197]
MNEIKLKEKWFIIPKPVFKPRLRVFCFPYAGGNATTYIPWAEHMPHGVELVAVQPPGRATRIMEPALDEMDKIIKDLMLCSDYITETPYIFIGHSLGSRMAFALAIALEASGFDGPQHFIASGSRAANICALDSDFHTLPDNLFIEKLKDLNGTPQEVLDNLELIQFLLPLLRADFRIAYKYQSPEIKIHCPITVLGGDADDEVTSSQLAAWEQLTSYQTEIHYVKGDHFFIDHNRYVVIDKLHSIIVGLKHGIPTKLTKPQHSRLLEAFNE